MLQEQAKKEKWNKIDLPIPTLYLLRTCSVPSPLFFSLHRSVETVYLVKRKRVFDQNQTKICFAYFAQKSYLCAFFPFFSCQNKQFD